MPLDSDDSPDPYERQRLSALVLAVTDDDFLRHEPPPDLWDSLADRTRVTVAWMSAAVTPSGSDARVTLCIREGRIGEDQLMRDFVLDISNRTDTPQP